MSTVVDNANNTSGFNDFNKIGDDYTYDVNGNMITDKNKNITSISYNHLNLPKKITLGTTGNIEYFYNALGQKIQKIVNETGKTTIISDYLKGFQYKDNVLEFFPTAEGYVKNTSGSLSYVFQYKDHLGNIRLSYVKNPTTQVLEIIEENNYYPFGLKHKGYNDYMPNTNKYKFQGQELQDELELGWYSYKWRNYNPAIGRFMSIDPLTEKYEDYTPYQFSSNQPVHAKELEGLESSNDLNKNKPTPKQRAYNSKTGNTDLLKVVVFTISDALQSLNTYTGDKKDKPKHNDIGSTATSKNGRGGNETTDGKKKGDNIDADAFATAAPGGAKTGNKYKSGKDFVEAMNDILGGIDAGWKNVENGETYVQELVNKYGEKDQTEYVTTYDSKTGLYTQTRSDVYEAQQQKKQEEQKQEQKRNNEKKI